MTELDCPPFLKPRLRLFLSADIVGSTSLKQTRSLGANEARDSANGPAWFSAIQGFYFEAAQAFLSEWRTERAESERADTRYGDDPTFWKSIGDEVLFTKILSDHRQLSTTLQCWMSAVRRMRAFLKNENSSLDVKCTAWLAGFPFRNREVAIGLGQDAEQNRIEDYYHESGILLNRHYAEPNNSSVAVDYIGPSIDTGFRLTGFSSGRKMVVSIDVAYILSMTSFDGEVKRIDLHYDGLHPLKGVMGGASYPIFWVNMSGENSLSVKEDKLKSHTISNKEDVKEFCDAFYKEYNQYTFRPFISGDIGETLSIKPDWYLEYHSLLVKNFHNSGFTYDSIEQPSNETEDIPLDKEDINDIVERISIEAPKGYKSPLGVGQKVHHSKFGDGIVAAITDNKAEVNFDKSGIKYVLDTFLQVLG